MMSVRRVGPQYAATLEIPIVQGRNIEDTDRHGGESVAVINREAARRRIRPAPGHWRFATQFGAAHAWR